jgi:tetratricopeptide (TPR) repeat protein
MRRILAIFSLALFLGLVGCRRQAPPPELGQEEPAKPVLPNLVVEPPKPPEGPEAPKRPAEPIVDSDLAKQEKYETALADALRLLGDQKPDEALIAFEAARSIMDTDFVRAEIDKLKGRIEQHAAAKKTVQDIETVLEEGRAKEAAQLIRKALEEYGGTDLAPQLTKLRLQADALVAAGQSEDAAARYQRFRDEGEAALRDKNLRAAALAFEQALNARDDARLKEQLDQVRGDLARYDDSRRKAQELRRDPAQLEEAIEALKDAAKAWDTLQVRQELDECTLALQKRRDRVGVADFEVRGYVGTAHAGRTIAEELLPHLKPRFDLVERGQITKVVDELKLEAGIFHADSQREVGKLAKLDYLVVGSVSDLGGLTVNARLVDVRSGLVVQTAKVAAPTMEALLPLLAEVGQQLLMSDEEKMAYDQERARQAPKPPAPIAAEAPLPPVPLPALEPPPPVHIYSAALPAFGGLRPEDFHSLPLPPPPGKPLPPPPVLVGEDRFRNRLLHLALEVGDNNFRRGQFQLAQRHFDLALNLAPGHFDVRLRLDRLTPLLPPPPLVVVERSVIVVQPRIAIFNFAEIGDPRVVRPGLGLWTAQQLAPYFSPAFEVADPGEVYWYMGRLGMTQRDLLTNPWARRWLGRALNVRYFVFGTLRETASFDVNTYLIDAEYGWLQGNGRIHVRGPRELKLRLGELAQLTQMDPHERARFIAENLRYQKLLIQAQQRLDQRDFQIAINIFHDALKVRPNSVEVLVHLGKARQLAEQAALQAERQRALEFHRAKEAEQQRRQFELARAADLARLRALDQGRALADAERRRIEDERLRAHNRLIAEARLALKIGNFQVSVKTFESALALRASDDIHRELAVARAGAEAAARERALREQAEREAALRRQREDELTQARRQLDKERRRQEAEQQARLKAQDERDRAAYQQAFDEGQRLFAKAKYDGAIAAFQTARRVRKTDEVEASLNQAIAAQAKATADARGAKALRELEEKLAQEKTLRQKAEAEAKRNQQLYLAALELANKALTAKNYPAARAKYEEAGKIFRTDAVLTGLRKIDEAQADAAAQAAAAKQKALEEERRTARLQKLMKEGEAALQAKQFDAAITAYSQAKKLAPGNVEVLSGLSRAEQARERTAVEARRKTEEQERQRNFVKLLDAGQANLANKQYDAAVLALNEALKLKPGDAKATAALQSAEKARSGAVLDAKAKAEAKQKAEAYQKLMAAGRLALSGKNFDVAIKAFGEAQKLVPGDRGAADFLKEAQKGKSDAAATLAAAAKQRAAEIERAEKLRKLLADGQAATKARQLDAAGRALEEARKLAPTDPAVLRALQDLEAARRADAKAAEARDKQRDAEKRQQDLSRLLKQGQDALAAKRFAEAQKAFSDALKLSPNEPAATRGLREATQALESPKTKKSPPPPPPPPPPPKANVQEQYQREMQKAAALYKEQKFGEAMNAYEAALKLVPNDANAKTGLRNATFSRHIVEGQAHLRARRFTEATREFEAALRIQPDNATARMLLQRAKQGKN